MPELTHKFAGTLIDSLTEAVGRAERNAGRLYDPEDVEEPGELTSDADTALEMLHNITGRQ